MSAGQFLSAYEPEVLTAAKRVFNTYGGSRMGMADRLEAVIDLARNVPASELSNERVADILGVLDAACEDSEIASALIAEQARP
jgi:hypothetical protein